MTSMATAIAPRANRYYGMGQIFLLNWPRYLAAMMVAALAAIAACTLHLPAAFAAPLLIGAGLATFWIVSSLLASHWVYDRSGLMDCRWVAAHLRPATQSWVNIHAGLDETTLALRREAPVERSIVLDIYDPVRTTEASIARARTRYQPPVTPVAATFDHLPLSDNTWDNVFLLMAAHEIRESADRAAFFSEISRVLTPGGRVILAEHDRDIANFIAFGPGFLHFLARRCWLDAAAQAGLALRHRGRITPFIRVYVWEKTS